MAILIRARQVLRAKGLDRDYDIKALCEHAGISRKTGYQWAKGLIRADGTGADEFRDKFAQLQTEHEQLKKRYDDLEFVYEGRKLAWEIHGVDELLVKKNTTRRNRKKKP